MKKIIQTIATGFFIVLFSSAIAHADTTLNMPGELPTLTVSSTSANNCSRGAIDSCWTTSTTANPGDTVAVQIYYRNTGGEVSKDTTLTIRQKSISTTNTATFYGGVASNTADQAAGYATVNMSTASSLTFIPGTARWYPSAGSAAQSVNETTLFQNGFFIGDIAPGEQGVLAANFRVGGSSSSSSCSISNFSPTDRTIDRGDSTRLNWTTTGCTSVTVSTVGSGLDANSSEYVSPTSDRTYTLTAYPGGSTATTTVYVRNSNTSCDIDYFTANSSSSTTINRGDTATLRWGTTNTTNVDISPNYSGRAADGSISVSPYSSTTYVLTAENGNCTRSQSVTVYVRDTAINSMPQAITTTAVVTGYSTAQLNGIAVPNTSNTTNAWFEWGNSTGLGSRTGSQSINSNASTVYRDTVSGLSTGTTYYYRAVVQNNNGTAYGDIVPFRVAAQQTYTPPTYTPKPTQPKTIIKYVPVQQQTQVVNTIVAQSAASLLELRVESAYDRMCIGGTMDYTITYHNLSSIELTDAVVRIVLPKELTYTSSSGGYFEPVSRTLTIDLGRIAGNETNRITIRAKVNELAVRGNLTVTTATVVYTNTATRAQENAIAYSLITVSDVCPDIITVDHVQYSGYWWFLPHSLIEWLLLLLIIFALIVLGRQLQQKKAENK